MLTRPSATKAIPALVIGILLCANGLSLIFVVNANRRVARMAQQLEGQNQKLEFLAKAQVFSADLQGRILQEISKLEAIPRAGDAQQSLGMTASSDSVSRPISPSNESALHQEHAPDEAEEYVPKAKSLVENALQIGRWTTEDKMALRLCLPHLPPQEAEALTKRVIEAFNRRQLIVQGPMPIF
jgi:DNA-directed RNA polymerase specialized sigma24 family protein